jgi:hypothetical protein
MSKLIPVTRNSLKRDTRASVEVQNKLDRSTNLEDFVREITTEWINVRQRFLIIGQYLVTAKINLPHGEYIKMINERLPFGRNVAHQLASVYLSVQNEEVPAEALPSSYTTAYRIVRMDPTTRARAMAEGVITPEVTFKTITRFIKEKHSTGADGIQRLHEERAALQRELARIMDRASQIKARLEDIDLELEGH